jgi:deaminated glutathione amidase
MLAAAVQLSSTPDQQANLRQAMTWLDQAQHGGAELIVLPELFASYGDLQLAADQAEPLGGPIVSMLRDWTARHQVWLVTGSLAELDPVTRTVYNTSLLLDPRGAIAARYRKRHLFNIDLSAATRCSEGDVFTPGEALACVTTSVGTLGWGICFDLRFPEQFRHLSRSGMEILLAPSAFTATTGAAHWELLLRARAVENLCYVVAANQVGAHSATMQSYGRSCIVDPWGKILACVQNDEPGLVIAEIDLNSLHDLRKRLPVHRLRRD